MTAWKPGDVAMVQCSDGEWRRATHWTEPYTGPRWVFQDNSRRRVSESTARPLVVVDPEDRDQVVALMDSWGTVEGWDDWEVDRVQAGFRSLAQTGNPPEPSGIGAVVVDQDDITYVLAGRLSSDGFELPDKWRAIDGPIVGDWKNWDQINVKQVLSVGVVG